MTTCKEWQSHACFHEVAYFQGGVYTHYCVKVTVYCLPTLHDLQVGISIAVQMVTVSCLLVLTMLHDR